MMGNSDFVALLYLLKTWKEPANLEECACKFAETKKKIQQMPGDRLAQALGEDGFTL